MKNGSMKQSLIVLTYPCVVIVLFLLQGCGFAGYHIAIYKNKFPYSGEFQNRKGLHLAYRIRFPYREYGDSSDIPLLLYIDGSGPFPLGTHSDRLLSHFQSKGFVAAMKQKRGVSPSEGDFAKLTFEDRVQDNLDFIKFLLQEYPEIDAEQVYIMGHSEGATIAGTVAYRYRKTAGLIWVSACFDEDWFDVIVSQHSEDEKEIIEQIRLGEDTDGKWQYYSKQWWYQHFNHSHLPELMDLSCPIIFLMGDKDLEFPPLQKRFREMLAKGKEDISLFIITSVGHDTSAPINQESLLSSIDLWLEDISKENRR